MCHNQDSIVLGKKTVCFPLRRLAASYGNLYMESASENNRIINALSFSAASRHRLPWCLSDSVLRRVSGGILIILWQKTGEKSSLLPRLCECQCGHKQKNLPPEWFFFFVVNGRYWVLLFVTRDDICLSLSRLLKHNLLIISVICVASNRGRYTSRTRIHVCAGLKTFVLKVL